MNTFKLNLGKTILIISSAFLFSYANALTELPAFKSHRYLVVYKSNQDFKLAKSQINKNSSFVIQNSLDHVNSVVVDIPNPKDLEALKSNPHVAFIEPEIFRSGPRTFIFKSNQLSRNQIVPVVQAPSSVDPQNFTAGEKTPWGILAVKAPEAWKLSDAGAKARVLILDSGVDVTHPSLMQNFELGKNFTQSLDGLGPDRIEDNSGHGTHVAGTALASINVDDGFTGVAPLSKLLMGRVCGVNIFGQSGCSNIAIVEGINWGVSQKVDVISMSLGGGSATPGERQAILNAERAGIFVVAASGNGGVNQVSFPAALPFVTAVGSVGENLVKSEFSQWGPQLAVVAPGENVYSSVPQGTGRETIASIIENGVSTKVLSKPFAGVRPTAQPKVAELVFAGLGRKEDFTTINVEGKIALIKRGEIDFKDKVSNALEAKAIAVLVFNNEPGLINPTLVQNPTDPEVDVTAIMIEQALGESLVTKLSHGEVLSASLQTKTSDYMAQQGTSMATPHVAGVIALIKSANKNLTPDQVRFIIKATSKPLGPNTNNEYGAGLIQADQAVSKALAL